MTPMQTDPAHAGDTVLLLTTHLAIGGAERHIVTLANLLSPRFRIVLAYLKPREGITEQIDCDALVELRCLHVHRGIDLRAARELALMAEAHCARAILCANGFALMYAQLARLLSGNRLVVIEIFHTTKLRTMRERADLLFYRPFFWLADHLVFVCDAQRRYWSRRGLWGRRTHTIHNGVDLQRFAPAAPEEEVAATRALLGFADSDRVVGICAVLRPEKAHMDLLHAVAMRRDQGEHWKVLLIGDGPMRAAIEQEVTRLGLGQSVRVTGFQADVRPWVAACDVVALVSTAIETFSIAALEAMAMGKPMIMSDIGGAREQVTYGENGLVFPPGNVAALAACLAKSWDGSETRRMGANARRRVEANFSLPTMIDRYGELLQSVFDSTRDPPQR